MSDDLFHNISGVVLALFLCASAISIQVDFETAKQLVRDLAEELDDKILVSWDEGEIVPNYWLRGD